MDVNSFNFTALGSQLLVGLSRTMILFIVCSGLSFILGVLRVPNLAHGSIYMIGAFSCYSLSILFGNNPYSFRFVLLLAPAMVYALEEQIRRLKESSLTVLLAEQNVKSTLKLSDRGYIIDNGRIRHHGSIEEMKENDEVRKACGI